jgi:hypothetical protein
MLRARARRRRSAMAAVGPSCGSTPLSGRATVPTPCLGPLGAHRLVRCPASRRASPGIRKPRPAPLATAARHRQGNPEPNSGRESTEGDPQPFSPPSLANTAARATGIWPESPAAKPKGYIARPHFFRGASAQNRISNSKRILLNLVNSLENRRKLRKMQTQFS